MMTGASGAAVRVVTYLAVPVIAMELTGRG